MKISHMCEWFLIGICFFVIILKVLENLHSKHYRLAIAQTLRTLFYLLCKFVTIPVLALAKEGLLHLHDLKSLFLTAMGLLDSTAFCSNWLIDIQNRGSPKPTLAFLEQFCLPSFQTWNNRHQVLCWATFCNKQRKKCSKADLALLKAKPYLGHRSKSFVGKENSSFWCTITSSIGISLQLYLKHARYFLVLILSPNFSMY